uniref:Uncharacterized protein n=1 Tax=Panagrolaimus sp. ES5 TaxID=591445 RepID=A0AC34FCU2_9BILA
MVDKGKIFKVVCIFLFVLTAICILSSFLSYWRYKKPSEEYVVKKSKINPIVLPPGFSQDLDINSIEDDETTYHYDLYGYVKSAKLKSYCVEKRETGKEPNIISEGWTGDKAVAALFILAFILYLVNILIMIISMVASAFPAKASFIHPIICFLATLFMIIAVIVLSVNKGWGWTWYPEKKTGFSPISNRTVVVHEQGYNNYEKAD